MELNNGIVVLFFLFSNSAFAGWFGPGQIDLQKISVKRASVQCQQGSLGFTVTNGSEYTLNEVEFAVIGKIPGRSSTYVLKQPNTDSQSFGTDVILQPGKSHTGCYPIDVSTWPSGENLDLAPKVIHALLKETSISAEDSLLYR